MDVIKMSIMSGDSMPLIWLVLLILLLIVEIITVGLTSIWAAGGALAALILSLIPVSVGWQIAAFLVVTSLLLIFTRPIALKALNAKREKTNYKSLIGKTIRITQRVDNLSETGSAVLNGTDWTVRTEDEGEILEEGTLAQVVDISGVKLIVKKYEED